MSDLPVSHTPSMPGKIPELISDFHQFLSPLRHPADVGHFPHHMLKGRRRIFFPPVPAVRRTQRHLRAGCAQAALVLLVATAARRLLLSAAAAPLL